MGNPARKIEQITIDQQFVVFFIPKESESRPIYNAILYSVHMPLFLHIVQYSSETHAIFMYIYVSYLTQKMIKNAIFF
jgi:hypothetical protein